MELWVGAGHLTVTRRHGCRKIRELGANTAATNVSGQTATDFALRAIHANCANWLRRCAFLPAVHRLCDRRASDAEVGELLRRGANPFLRRWFGATLLQICTLADPDQGALPEDEALTTMLREALQPWHEQRHHLFPRSFTPRVVAVLSCCWSSGCG